MNKRASSILLTGVLGLGGLAIGAVIAPAIAGAQTSDSSTAGAVGDRVSRISEALSGLVGSGTITQQQADQVATTLAEELRGRGGHGHGRGGRNLDTAAEVLDSSEDELRTALRGGQSLGDVAQAQGVDKQALVDALVTDANERITAKLADGDITQAEADQQQAQVVERVTAQVERQGLPGRGDRRPRPSAESETPQDE